MANEVKLPRLGQGMEAGTIVRWLKGEGDTVAKGEPLYELDTDKVTQEVESDFAGVLLSIVVVGGEVAVGTTIAVIGKAGERVAAAAAPAPAAPAAAAEPAPEPVAAAVAATAHAAAPVAAAAPAPAATAAPAAAPLLASVAVADGSRLKASPLARRIARERGVELASLVGTGPDGRIVAEDVERAALGAPLPAGVPAAQPSPATDAAAAPAAGTAVPAVPPLAVAGEGVQVEKLSGIRRTIARRLTEAWEAPAFQISMSAELGRVVALRQALVEQTPAGAVKPTVSDVLTKLVAVALMRHPAVNALWAGDSIHLYPTANVGIAVAIPNGLVVPVITSAERRSVAEIAAVRGALVERARAGKLAAEDMQGGTFSISNLGMFGVEHFIAVLNPPQAAILAVGAIEERPVARDGQVVIRPMMSLTLTCDHRALDGATASQFLATLKGLIEEPGLAL